MSSGKLGSSKTPKHGNATEKLGVMISLTRFELTFEGARPINASGYRGSAWRGVFGHALKRLVCITRERECRGCLVSSTCTYPYIFETQAARDGGEREDLSPHPFVLSLAAEWKPRQFEREVVGVTLFGEGCSRWPYVLQALREAGEYGVGKDRIPMRLRAIRQEQPAGSGQWTGIWDEKTGVRPAGTAVAEPGRCPKVIRIRLETPLRLRIQQHLIRPESLTPLVFLQAVERRASVITKLHGKLHGGPTIAGEGRLAERWAERVRELDRRLRWQDWERYSNRQQRKVPMGGVTGEWVWETGDEWEGWERLWLVQWLHAGKGTSMGLGRFAVEGV